MKTFARDADRRALRARLARLTPSTAARWGRMNAHQMVCHVTDAMLMMTGDLVCADVSTPLRRTMVKWIALYAPMEWPRGIQTTSELDQAAGGGTKPLEFARDLSALDALFDRVTVRAGTFGGRRHPIFGAMSEAAWLRWAYLHTDHHLRQFGV
ncbi:MAG TPA: DUF1569 domain-containing protein [Vicinamibacterales bacterium]|jgi:hypothetical protein|nr:DUF1569 domain-containing protein [Vicinamibacterales bacterium]